MIHQSLLRRAMAGRDPVLVDFVETLVPPVLSRFTSVPALGGSPDRRALEDSCLPHGIPHYPPEALERFSQNHDQSMTTHILNGIFAGIRIAEKLPPHKALDDLEKRLWLLGYVVHDYTKVYGIKVAAGDLSLIRQAIACLGDALNFGAFLPSWKDHLDDIAFLAQNTQTVEGANLNIREFTGLKTHLRRLEILRLLSSIADILVHITSPSDVVERGADDRDRASNLRDKLQILFGAGNAPRLAYHRLTEVRGLISNLINNAVMEALKVQDYEPFLFFPNGVVYLVAPNVGAQVDAKAIAEKSWARVIDIVADSDFGVRRAGTGFIPSSALLELTGMSGVLNAGRRKAMSIISSHASSRIYGFFTGKSDNDLLEEVGDKERVKEIQAELVRQKQLPDDVRVDRLGEYLTFVYRTVRDTFKKEPDTAPLLLAALDLSRQMTPEEATRQKGGTYFGWFYVAARYIEAHRMMDDNDVDDRMRDLGERVLSWIEDQSIVGRTSTAIGDSLKDYIVTHLESDGLAQTLNDGRESFAAELVRYSGNKSKRRPVCSLCSSPYEGVIQETTEMPFINQQYSNKNPLAAKTTIIRGVCPVCRIEMILRRVQQPELTEGNKPIQLYLYPTYFFTPETALVVKTYLNEAQDINIFGLINHLRKNGFTTDGIIDFDGWGGGKEEGHSYTFSRPRYSEHDATGLFMFALRPLGRKPTDTDAWILPTLYGLALPLLLNLKVVVTPSFVPVFGTGVDFRETVVLDAPHGFTRHVLRRDRFRVDEVGDYLIRLLKLYDLHLDVFAEPTDFHWAQINAVAKDVATDPLYVFAYYDRKARGDKQKGRKGVKTQANAGIPEWDISRYLAIYQTLGGEANMGFIGKLVDSYTEFYRARGYDLSAYEAVRPLNEAIAATVKSDDKTSRDDLALLIVGPLADVMERVWDGHIEATDPIIFAKDSPLKMDERRALSRQKQEAFVELFLTELFEGYCKNQRAVLQERANRIRSAARFYYLRHYYYNT